MASSGPIWGSEIGEKDGSSSPLSAGGDEGEAGTGGDDIAGKTLPEFPSSTFRPRREQKNKISKRKLKLLKGIKTLEDIWSILNRKSFYHSLDKWHLLDFCKDGVFVSWLNEADSSFHCWMTCITESSNPYWVEICTCHMCLLFLVLTFGKFSLFLTSLFLIIKTPHYVPKDSLTVLKKWTPRVNGKSTPDIINLDWSLADADAISKAEHVFQKPFQFLF